MKVFSGRLAPLTLAVAAATALAAVQSCSDSTIPAETFLGPTVQIGAGSARAYAIRLGDVPVELGLRMTEAALTNLPSTMPFSEFVLALPAEASVTPFNHATINFNPQGHPGMPYMVPHFDFHFYQLTVAQRAAIAPSDPQFQAKLALAPSAEFVPTGYAQNPGGVPNMGAHWLDPTSPELSGQLFTKTYVYGSYNGAFTFQEPMISKAFLETHPSFSESIKIPSRYASPGYYPTSYTVRYDPAAAEFTIALGGFVHRD